MGREIENEEVTETEVTTETTTTVTAVTVVEEMDCPEGYTAFTVSKDGKKAILSYNFGTDLESMVALFGDAVVFDQALANMKVRAQSVTRAALLKGDTCETVLGVWKPGEKLVAAPRDPEKDAMNYMSTLSAEELEKMLAALQSA